jgi:hypothetical protein
LGISVGYMEDRYMKGESLAHAQVKNQ